MTKNVHQKSETVRETPIELPSGNKLHSLDQETTDHDRAIYPLLFEAASDGVLIVDADGRIRLINLRAADMFGYEEQELLGQPVECLLPERFRESHRRLRAAYTANPISRPMGAGYSLLARRRDGSEFPVEISLSFVDSQDGPLIMGLVVDITDRVQSQELLQRQAQELQERNDQLATFAYTVAHDLKAPLAHIIGFSELVDEDFVALSQDEIHHYLRRIARNARKMSRIVDEMLLLADLGQNEDIELVPLDTAPIVDKVLWRLADQIEEQQATIIRPPNERWPPAEGNASWVEEIWTAYINNAIKHGGQPPRVELGFDSRAVGEPPARKSKAPSDLPTHHRPRVRFWVRDNGAGLSPEEQAQVFSHENVSGMVRVTGHGLRLPIIRRIVERMGGQVDVECRSGKGCVFSFTLARAPSQR
jgi:PAS domain S-box-containing protein